MAASSSDVAANMTAGSAARRQQARAKARPGDDWEMEQEEMSCDVDDGRLPPDAEHVAQPVLPPPGLQGAERDAEDQYITEVCIRVNNLGMDIWRDNLPTQDSPDYWWNPRDLPGLLGDPPGRIYAGPHAGYCAALPQGAPHPPPR